MRIQFKRAMKRLDWFRGMMWAMPGLQRKALTEDTVVAAELFVKKLFEVTGIYPVYSSVETAERVQINFNVKTKSRKKIKLHVTSSTIYCYFGRELIMYDQKPESRRINLMVEFFRKECKVDNAHKA